MSQQVLTQVSRLARSLVSAAVLIAQPRVGSLGEVVAGGSPAFVEDARLPGQVLVSGLQQRNFGRDISIAVHGSSS